MAGINNNNGDNEVMLTAEDARKFTSEWMRHLNERNVEGIVACYAGNGRLISPRAVGPSTSISLETREAIEHHYRGALQSDSFKEASLDYVVWDEAQQRLVLVYWKVLQEVALRTVELFDFDGRGKIMRGEVLYGPR